MMKKYIPVHGKGANMLRVEVSYNLGGVNYFTCRVEPRGYYLSVTPVTREVHGGLVSEGFTAFSGCKALLHEVKRRSAKAERIADEKAEELLPSVMYRVCEENDLIVREEVQE